MKDRECSVDLPHLRRRADTAPVGARAPYAMRWDKVAMHDATEVCVADRSSTCWVGDRPVLALVATLRLVMVEAWRVVMHHGSRRGDSYEVLLPPK